MKLNISGSFNLEFSGETSPPPPQLQSTTTVEAIPVALADRAAIAPTDTIARPRLKFSKLSFSTLGILTTIAICGASAFIQLHEPTLLWLESGVQAFFHTAAQPVSAKISQDTPEGKFVAKLYPAAVRMEKRHRVPARYAIATAALESGWGKQEWRKPQHNCHNYFGIKVRSGSGARGVRSQTTEEVAGQIIETYDTFQCFNSLDSALNEYARRLKEYLSWAGQPATLWETDSEKAMAIAYHYYATDSQYAKKHRSFLQRVDAILSPVKRTIAIAAGHYIHPGRETGAPNEREFNWLIANALEIKLKRTGWKVIRPDRDLKFSSWGHYMRWVREQEGKGIQVIEIHGQPAPWGLGVIGEKSDPFEARLAKEFGWLDVPLENYNLAREYGTIVEVFHSNRIPSDRKVAATKIAEKLYKAFHLPLYPRLVNGR